MRGLAMIATLLAVAAAGLFGWIAWQTADGSDSGPQQQPSQPQSQPQPQQMAPGRLIPSESDAPWALDGAWSDAADAGSLEEKEDDVAEYPLEYPIEFPTGWLIAPAEGVPAGVPVKLLYLPDWEAPAHRGGAAVSAEEQRALQDSWPVACADDAVIEYAGEIFAVDPNLLLVNLPDVLPQAEYDIAYAYAAPSNCAGEAIPGVTGERLNGYADGRQPNAYRADDQFIAPCAYQTALKARAASDMLGEAGLRLLVYDAYRPMAAQYQLSAALSAAIAVNPTMAAALGGWSADWFVAPGASGHNFGTDLDVAVCDQDGNPLYMPSSFDAFDESGRLTDYPVDEKAIEPGLYKASVAQNDACLALHQAFRAAGFTELASEWWHFGDTSTEYANRALVGAGGLDFVASL